MPEYEINLTGMSFLADLLAEPWVIFSLWAFWAGLVLWIVILILRKIFLSAGNLAKSFDKKILLVTVPKQTMEKDQTSTPTLQQIQEKIGIMEAIFSNTAGLKAEKGFKHWFHGFNNVFSFEMVVLDGKVNFFVVIPNNFKDYIEEQITAQFPHAFIEEMPDYNIFSPKGKIKSFAMVLTKPDFLPIKTYKKMESDPLNALTNALSKIDDKDGATIQITIKSAKPKWRNFGIRVASKMQQGKKYEDAYREAKGGLSLLFRDFAKAAKTKNPNQPGSEPQQYRLSPLEEEQVKGIEEKCQKAGADVNIRVVVCSENEGNLDLYLNNIVNAFAQYNIYKYGNIFEKNEGKPTRMITNFIYRHFDESINFVLNTENLASIFHFPIPHVNESPNIRWLDARKAPAPANILKQGLLIGYNMYRGRKTEIRIGREERRRHMYTIGMTGTGKSWYIEGMMMQDIANGEGCCYIDPHGDAIEHILRRIPKERAEDVVILDPGDVSRPIGLNLLEFKTQEDKTFAINELMAIFDKLYDLKATGGPMFEQYFKNAAALIMADPESGSTLMEISRVLADDDFRAYKLSKCQDQMVKDFWEKEAQKAGGEASLANMVPYITSKMSPFISNDYVRPIISQQNSTIDFAEIMNTKKILLVKLSKGKIGQINSNLLGMLVIGKLLMAALGRADMAEDERKDFYLYIDEFQNYLTDSMEIILSEARKYRLCLSIAHQYIGQLVKNNDTKFKDAIFGNVGTKCAFRIGVDDAEAMTKEFAGIFNENDFLNCPSYNCYVKLLINNANPPGFNMGTIHLDKVPGLPKENKELCEAIKQLSKLKYGKDIELVNMEVSERQQRVF
ncbi:MAG: type IV secretion system DNA-binding domain-containing protein [Patescibacteria group bacterium]